MSHFKHKIINVMCLPYIESYKHMDQIHSYAKDLFGGLVSDIITTHMEGFKYFFISGDGYKESSPGYEKLKNRREMLYNFINSYNYEDGSNPIRYVEVDLPDNDKPYINKFNY